MRTLIAAALVVAPALVAGGCGSARSDHNAGADQGGVTGTTAGNANGRSGSGGTAGGGADTSGGAADVAGASSGGAGGGAAGGGAEGPCAGLDGEWTMTPTITEMTLGYWLGPKLGQELPSVGLVFAAAGASCRVTWRPLWGRTGTAELSAADGSLVSPYLSGSFSLADNVTGTLFWDASCPGTRDGWMWSLLHELSVTAGAPSMARVSNEFYNRQVDTAGICRGLAEGALSRGLPPSTLRAADSLLIEPVCWTDASADAPVALLPWTHVLVLSSQPLGIPAEHLRATIDGSPLDAQWGEPTDPLDVDRLASGVLPAWDVTMGHQIEVSLDSNPESKVVFQVPALALETAFEAETLAALYTPRSDGALETVGGVESLCFSFHDCGGVMAAGLLDVTGKARVRFEFEQWGSSPVLTPRVVARDGTEYAVSAEPNDGSARLSYVAEVAGATMVGVELSVKTPYCPPLVPEYQEVRIYAIRGE